jgi:2-keto-3-deoxy-L-rhamnonate aldolase RhmA
MTLKQRLANRDLLVGTFLKTPSPIVCEVLARTELDLVCIDAEHAPFDRRDIDACLLALSAGAKPALVRVPSSAPEHILNALDCGADGVLCPHILSGAHAAGVAAASRYGAGRGFAGSSRSAGYTSKSMAQHLADSSDRTVVIGQIEDREALENLDGIFAQPDIDAFFIGRADLTVSLGLTNPNHPDVLQAVEHVARAGLAAGRVMGMFTANLDEIPRWRNLGVTLFILGSDHGFILSGAAAMTSRVRTGT